MSLSISKKNIKTPFISNTCIFSTVEYLKCFIETAHWCSTSHFRPLKFCYLWAVEIYKLLSVPVKKPVHCLTTKSRNLVKRVRHNPCSSHFFFFKF